MDKLTSFSILNHIKNLNYFRLNMCDEDLPKKILIQKFKIYRAFLTLLDLLELRSLINSIIDHGNHS